MEKDEVPKNMLKPRLVTSEDEVDLVEEELKRKIEITNEKI
jgi:hypothetical protein